MSDSTGDPLRAVEPSRGAVAVAAAACVAIAGILSWRALVGQPPSLWFDVDPVSDPFPFAGIAPSTGLAVDALTLILACLSMLAVRRGIDRVGAALAVLAAIGAIPIVIHSFNSPDHLWRGLQWMSAMGSAAAIVVSLRAMSHERSRATRAVLAGVLLAAIVPMAWHGVLQVWMEHPAMVEEFRAHRSEILAARGWAEGSSQALTYERRLMQPEATAWFGLSNVASSALAAGALTFAGAAFALRRVRPAGALLLGLVSAVATALVVVNGSKGALLSLLVGTMFAAWCMWRAPSARTCARIATALVALVLVAVMVRGWVGERSSERSLLFRSHYVDAAVQVFGDHPWLGVGPAGFGESYLAARPDRSPEEVQSAHAAWADWLVSMGICGAAWIVLFGALVALAAQGSAHARTSAHVGVVSGSVVPSGAGGARDEAAPANSRVRDVSFAWSRGPIIAALVVLVVSILAMLPESASLDDGTLLMRVLAALFAASIAGATVRAVLLGGRAWSAAIAGAVLLLAMHGQIEMTLWWPGSVGRTVALIAVGAAFAVPRSASDRWSSIVASIAAIALLVPATLGVIGAQGSRAAEAVVARAAQPLAAFGLARLGIAPAPATSLASARMQAALTLLEHPANPWLDRPAVVSVGLQQLASAVSAVPPGDPHWAAHAILLANHALDTQKSESVAASAALVAESLYEASTKAATSDRNNAPDRAAIIALLQRAAEYQVKCNPRSVRGWTRLADVAEAQGDHDAQRSAALRALAADETFELDPLRRLPDSARNSLHRQANK